MGRYGSRDGALGMVGRNAKLSGDGGTDMGRGVDRNTG